MISKSITTLLKTDNLLSIHLAITILLLSGCAFSNEGAIDYRRAEVMNIAPHQKSLHPTRIPLLRHA